MPATEKDGIPRRTKQRASLKGRNNGEKVIDTLRTSFTWMIAHLKAYGFFDDIYKKRER